MAKLGLHHASMSKTDLLLQCGYWASPAVHLPPEPDDIREIDDVPRFGIAVHKTMERHLVGRQRLPNKVVAEIATEHHVEYKRLASYYDRLSTIVDKLCVLRSWNNADYWYIECKLAYDPFSRRSRFLPATGSRDYSGRTPYELPGTGDFIIVDRSKRELTVIDWKSGQSSYDAKLNGQLRSLMLAMLGLIDFEPERMNLIIIRIDDEFIESSEAVIDRAAIDNHARRLRNAIGMAISMNPHMRLNIGCQYCPALEVCPAHAGPMALAEDYVLSEKDQAARVYIQLLAAEKLLHKVRDRVRTFVELNGPVQLDNGKWLTNYPTKKENLSKASIVRALGRVDGEELIDQLRGKGAVETIEGTELRQLIDPSSRK